MVMDQHAAHERVRLEDLIKGDLSIFDGCLRVISSHRAVQ